jgi:hypothetical protein
VLAAQSQEMRRGQAEALMPMAETVLREAGLGWADLSGVACCTGPGNFTGIRLSVAAIRGIALSLDIPAIGVGAFEAEGGAKGLTRAATRGRHYIWDGVQILEREGEVQPTVPLAVEVTRVAAMRLGTPQPVPAPIYVRPPDAALPSTPPPPLLD